MKSLKLELCDVKQKLDILTTKIETLDIGNKEKTSEIVSEKQELLHDPTHVENETADNVENAKSLRDIIQENSEERKTKKKPKALSQNKSTKPKADLQYGHCP